MRYAIASKDHRSVQLMQKCPYQLKYLKKCNNLSGAVKLSIITVTSSVLVCRDLVLKHEVQYPDLRPMFPRLRPRYQDGHQCTVKLAKEMRQT